MKKKKTQKNVRLQGRFISLPELKEDFKKAEAEEQEKAEAEAAKQAKKNTEDDEQLMQIEHDT